MSTTNYLNLSFERADGKIFNMTVQDYKPELTNLEILDAIAAIFEANVFQPEGYDLVKVNDATKVSITKDIVTPG